MTTGLRWDARIEPDGDGFTLRSLFHAFAPLFA